MKITNKLNGDTVTLDGLAFWLNSALESKVGIAVARVDAKMVLKSLMGSGQRRTRPQMFYPQSGINSRKTGCKMIVLGNHPITEIPNPNYPVCWPHVLGALLSFPV